MSARTIARWTPVLSGNTYCSPACGGGCHYSAFLTANKKANALARALWTGWMPMVWENLGWYYAARKGCAEVHPLISQGYICFLNANKQCVGKGATPKLAVEAAVKQLQTVIHSLQDSLDELRV